VFNGCSPFFGIDSDLVFTLFDNEGGKIGSFVLNTNGSWDIGPMQINSSNLAEVKSHFPAITWRELAYDPCASFWVGTWWLHRKIIDRKGMFLKELQTITAEPHASEPTIFSSSWNDITGVFSVTGK
jgi:hypothetical protein